MEPLLLLFVEEVVFILLFFNILLSSKSLQLSESLYDRYNLQLVRMTCSRYNRHLVSTGLQCWYYPLPTPVSLTGTMRGVASVSQAPHAAYGLWVCAPRTVHLRGSHQLSPPRHTTLPQQYECL